MENNTVSNHLRSRSKISIAHSILNPKFLEAGRFLALPGGIEPPERIYVAESDSEEVSPIHVTIPKSDLLRDLSRSMSFMWEKLHERASRITFDNPLNANTATRYAYNTFGIRHILRHLEEKNIREARIILVTGYESPIQELLESEWVAEVLVVDLSLSVLEAISEKYYRHLKAEKLSLKVLDFSGLDPHFMESEIARLPKCVDSSLKPDSEALIQHFSEIGSGNHLCPLPLQSDSFEAAHLPFMLGSLHLTPITAVMKSVLENSDQISGMDYEEFISKHNLRTIEAQRSALTVMNHAISETRRILQPGGLMVMNLWARPQKETPGLIRLSDTPVSPTDLDRTLRDCQLIFSGNPQPLLPYTVGHILFSYGLK